MTGCRQDALGYASDHDVIRSIDRATLEKKGDQKSIGNNWIYGFKKTYPSLRTKMVRRMEEDIRFDASTHKAAY
ncbi:hypothetical protein DL767_011114 [Monosporascus sp. MG133]|nr:hypothetical protein DL767_011114 [Monosporascus sp. MG133]